jgi:hypothetical protein
MKLTEERVGHGIAEGLVRVMREVVVMAAVLDLQTGCHG